VAHYQYLLLLGACLLVTLPLEFVLRARVYRRPRLLWRALWPVVLAYSIWDIVGISRGHWNYSQRYTTGLLLPLRMPVEELLFFIVVPICGLLTWEAVGHVLTRIRRPGSGDSSARRSRRPRRGRADA
jgi:lycopene cyclase domain-containing protein